VIGALGEVVDSGIPGLTRLVPSAERVAEAGVACLVRLGVPRVRADVIVAVARAVATSVLRLEPSSDVATTRRDLLGVVGVGDRLASAIVMCALSWPDAFPAEDRALQRAAGAATAQQLAARAEQWRPWRAYAALHLWLPTLAQTPLVGTGLPLGDGTLWGPVDDMSVARRAATCAVATPGDKP